MKGTRRDVAAEPGSGARNFFLWLSVVGTLYASAVAFIALLFSYIDYVFPSELERFVDPYSPGIRVSIATLLVVFPVFLFLVRRANQMERTEYAARMSGVRKWLLYLTLALAGATLAIDLITLINAYLGGELTVRFALKTFVVFATAGGVFAYFFLALRGYWQAQERRSVYAGILSALIVITAVTAGFFIIGTPAEQRALRLDEQRVEDLRSIQYQLVDWWQRKGALPDTLAELNDPLGRFTVPTDPERGAPYEYKRTGELSFFLCADFSRSTPDRYSRAPYSRPAPAFQAGGDGSWEHRAGRECFTRTIDPDLYPPVNKTPELK